MMTYANVLVALLKYFKYEIFISNVNCKQDVNKIYRFYPIEYMF